MPTTRRSLARSILGATLAPAALGAGARTAAAQPGTAAAAAGGAAAAMADIRGHLRRARAALPANRAGARIALDRTLERLDDLAIEPSTGRLILVNIAAAELIAYDNGREVLRSRVVVGANKTRTPQLATFVTAARCNPPWYVPASIVPEIRAAGLTGFRWINGKLVQPPGPTNPLGILRIGLLDSDGIFLHGTSSPSAFSRPSRALSHGCVRVERIRDLAAWMLDRTGTSLQATLDTGRTYELPPTQEVQVALAYLTAWTDSAGRVVTHGDPYGLDAPGTRRAPYRRVSRPALQTPEEAETTARPPPQEDNPL
ncbi:L,D-transpeptidase family protein [Pararoseomonas indoligenes]|uniref:L,D-transpeptidase family protein n=1 Tax=Roseomonas indoligenes TaxID=2820811 RepID=A0A940MXV8_9PROT|nr:L,D-transpeptidase family protein [Pararoseomonas indoligenes]MBP0493688.1 L,D-transpeptidase family protein [Pararoseomonas indoligenes]